GVITGQLGEAVLMRIAKRFAECSFGVAARNQQENPQVLLTAGRGVIPGHERATASLGLANAEAEPRIDALAIASIPGGLLVVGQVARVIKLMRRREASDRPAFRLSHDRPMLDREWLAQARGVEVVFHG